MLDRPAGIQPPPQLDTSPIREALGAPVVDQPALSALLITLFGQAASRNYSQAGRALFETTLRIESFHWRNPTFGQELAAWLEESTVGEGCEAIAFAKALSASLREGQQKVGMALLHLSARASGNTPIREWLRYLFLEGEGHLTPMLPVAVGCYMAASIYLPPDREWPERDALWVLATRGDALKRGRWHQVLGHFCASCSGWPSHFLEILHDCFTSFALDYDSNPLESIAVALADPIRVENVHHLVTQYPTTWDQLAERFIRGNAEMWLFIEQIPRLTHDNTDRATPLLQKVWSRLAYYLPDAQLDDEEKNLLERILALSNLLPQTALSTEVVEGIASALEQCSSRTLSAGHLHRFIRISYHPRFLNLWLAQSTNIEQETLRLLQDALLWTRKTPSISDRERFFEWLRNSHLRWDGNKIELLLLEEKQAKKAEECQLFCNLLMLSNAREVATQGCDLYLLLFRWVAEQTTDPFLDLKHSLARTTTTLSCSPHRELYVDGLLRALQITYSLKNMPSHTTCHDNLLRLVHSEGPREGWRPVAPYLIAFYGISKEWHRSESLHELADPLLHPKETSISLRWLHTYTLCLLQPNQHKVHLTRLIEALASRSTPSLQEIEYVLYLLGTLRPLEPTLNTHYKFLSELNMQLWKSLFLSERNDTHKSWILTKVGQRAQTFLDLANGKCEIPDNIFKIETLTTLMGSANAHFKSLMRALAEADSKGEIPGPLLSDARESLVKYQLIEAVKAAKNSSLPTLIAKLQSTTIEPRYMFVRMMSYLAAILELAQSPFPPREQIRRLDLLWSATPQLPHLEQWITLILVQEETTFLAEEKTLHPAFLRRLAILLQPLKREVPPILLEDLPKPFARITASSLPATHQMMRLFRRSLTQRVPPE